MNEHPLSNLNDHVAMFSVLHEAQAQLPSTLHEYLQVTNYGISLNHPFCFVPPAQFLFGKSIAGILDSIHSRRERFEHLCADGNWEDALWTVERPYRPQFLAELIERHGVEKMYSAIASVWTDTETAYFEWENWEFIWDEVAASKRGERGFHVCQMMSAQEGKYYAKLPAEFTIYRGFSDEDGEFGWSWTLDREKAEWFARRSAISGDAPRVATAVIKKANAFAYFSGRNEAEIVVDISTGCLNAVTIEVLPPMSREAAA